MKKAARRRLLLFCLAAGLSIAGAAQDPREIRQWTARGPFGTPSVTDIAVDPSRPSRLYATVGDDVWVSDDAGARWHTGRNAFPRCCSDGPPLALAISADGARAYAVTFGAVFESDDGGDLWTITSAGLPPLHDLLAIAADPSDPLTAFIGTDAGVFKTIDGGATWKSSNSGLDGCPLASGAGPCPVNAFAFDPDNPSIVYAGTLFGLFRSTDAGAHWAGRWRVAELDAAQAIASVAAGSFEGKRAIYAALFRGGVFRSTNEGETWTDIRAGLPESVSELAVDRGQTGIVFAATFGGLKRSGDGGATWQDSGSGLASTSGPLAVLSSGSVYFGPADGGGVFASSDAGVTWIPRSDGLPRIASAASAVAVDPSAPSRLFSAFGRRLFRSNDSGATWRDLSSRLPLSGNAIDQIVVDPAVPSTVYLTRLGALFKSTDLGDDWRAISDEVFSVGPMIADPVRPSVLYQLSAVLGLSTSVDGGETWSRRLDLAPGLPGDEKLFTVLAADPARPNVLFAGTRGASCHSSDTFGCDFDAVERIFKSDDGGLHWRATTGYPQSSSLSVNAIVPDPLTGSVYALVGSAILKSTDGGESWGTPLARPGSGRAVGSSLLVDPAFPSTLYLSSDEGVFETTDGGQSWFAIDGGLDGHASRLLGSAASRIYAATDDGIWAFEDAPMAARRIVPAVPEAPVPVGRP